jgi:hypothetical protein
MKIRAALTLAFLASTLFCPAQAQQADGGWHYLAQGYAMFPNMKGEVGLGNLPTAPVDEGPSDIFSNLQMGAMFYFEAHDASWAFSSDVLYMDLGSDIRSGTLISDGSVDVAQLGWELAAMRRLNGWFELGLAATYNKIDADVKINFNSVLLPSVSNGLSEEWIDPSIVMRATIPLRGKWSLQARGNIGGFGIGSDLMWQIQADVNYRHSDAWLFTFGYRVIDVDYDHGSGSSRFVYNMQTFGPVLKVGYSF